MNSNRRGILLALAAVALRASTFAYGPVGHEIVGAIADERLANTPEAAKVNALLDGLTLEKAAVIADEIKGWDKNGANDPRSFRYSAHRNIDRQLRDFWKANRPTHEMNSAIPSHHWFHYTDVPILPLHVGAAYFDEQGRFAEPEKNKAALADEGGNTFTLELSDEPPRRRGIHKKKFHGFWDYDAVNALFAGVPRYLPSKEFPAQIEPMKKALVDDMARQEPRNWRMPSNISVNSYAEIWADEILPIAREAHARLEFRKVKPLLVGDRTVATGEALEKPAADETLYRKWASMVAREELHKAGWRLADLLQKIL